MSGEYARDFDQWDSSGNFKVMNVDKCYPLFSTKFKQNKTKSLAEGRVVGDEVEMVEIVVAGDRLQSWAGKVTDEHRTRWPMHYKAWKEGKEPPINGTPLEQWPLITTSFLHELKAMGVRSVEDLAGLSDTLAQSFMGGSGWRTKANEFLNKDGTAAQKTIRDLQERLAQLEGKTAPAAEAAPIAVAAQAGPVDIAAIVAQAVAAAVAALPVAAAGPVSAVKPKKELSEKKKAAMANMVGARMAKRAAKAAQEQ